MKVAHKKGVAKKKRRTKELRKEQFIALGLIKKKAPKASKTKAPAKKKAKKKKA